MQSQTLTLDIIVSDSSVPGANSNIPQLGEIGNFLTVHPLLWVVVLCIIVASALLLYTRAKVKTLGGGSVSYKSKLLFLLPLLFLAPLAYLTLSFTSLASVAVSTLNLQLDSAHLTIEIDKTTTADNSGTATGNTSSTTTITGASANGYELITKLSQVDGTVSIMQETGIALSIIEPDGTLKSYDAVNNDDIDLDTSSDVTSRAIFVTVPETVVAGAYALAIVYEAEDNTLAPAQATYCTTTFGSDIKDTRFIVEKDANMLPITYTGDTTTPEWQIADNTNWCNYDQQQWANAVTVSAAKLADYLVAVPGTPEAIIDENDVLGYFVYVPRYAYEVQRFNAWDKPVCGNNQMGSNYADADCTSAMYQARFDIRFERATDTKKTADQGVICTTPPSSPVTADSYDTGIDYRTGCGVDRAYGAATGTTWQTHPAFTLGAVELNGLWVGKFETTGTNIAPTVKPNQHANISEVIGRQYDLAKSIGVTDNNAIGGNGTVLTQNSHGLDATKSHQMKNSEWGAVAYLADSIYGSNGAVVQINAANPTTSADADGTSSRLGITGCGPTSAGATGTYTDGTPLDDITVFSATACSADISRAYYGTLGRLASTTQNPWGVYDMSGGTYEYVMGNYNNNTVNTTFMTTMPAANYCNIYLESDGFNSIATRLTWMSSLSPNSHNFDYCTQASCGGQGNFETTSVQSVSAIALSWGSDFSSFVSSTNYPWTARGDNSSGAANAGLWSSYDNMGNARVDYGFRVVLWL